MRVSGACRSCEVTNLKISDVEDRGAYLLISIPDSKTGISREFTIIEKGFSINSVETCRKNIPIRPKKLSNDRFFCDTLIKNVLHNLLETFCRKFLQELLHFLIWQTQKLIAAIA